ncbi:MAG: prolipoprotein diacylglyceryl transferase [Acidobacteria bacterium]|nr:prolipoprotein diacylglyceryl transferase [Acidobacteriota bacterium]MCA1639537.1 prolipoprotein diacylglyceryl transferase [Acidobacteriota bacterium]
MAVKDYSIIGKILYALLFVVVLPVLLIVWAWMTEKSVSLTAIQSLPIGLIIAFSGAFMMISGMAAIYLYGKGLPMNAYPPARFVVEGIYRFLPHPIYTGFSILCVGVSVAAGSSSGLWLVSPIVILGCAALVQGYEKQATRERFGQNYAQHYIHVPTKEALPPTMEDRISVYIIAIIPWLLFCQTALLIGTAPDTVNFLSSEFYLPAYELSASIYWSRYLFILTLPLVAKTARDLREFLIFGSVSTGIALLLFIAFPYVASQLFTLQSSSNLIVLSGQRHGVQVVIYLSSHIVWTLLATKIYAKTYDSWKNLFSVWALLIVASGIVTGTHTILDISVGLTLFLFAIKIREVWEYVRLAFERIANSWTEWRFGSVRLINHGFYVGAGAFVALSIVGTLLGPAYTASILILAASGIIMSALSAQWIEGSSRLLRPFGWFGGMLGSIIGLFIAKLLGGDTWLLFAAFCVGVPWAQAAGRLRCLIQGCCHGREAPAEIGIRYVHPLSRVCRFTNLAGIPIHPTPLYSILYNAAVAIVIMRLWLAQTSISLVIGIYFILTGLGRFVEESYRGEPQTPVFGGLRLYQLIAIFTVVGGVFITMVGNTTVTPEPQLNWQSIVASGCFGIFVCIAFGLDFPNSNKRFARLT